MTGSDKHSLLVSNASRTRKMVMRERAGEPAPEVDVLETTIQALVVVIAFIALLVMLSR